MVARDERGTSEPLSTETEMTTEKQDADPYCPFYGRSGIHAASARGAPLISSGGNQCALIVEAHSPCIMERSGDQPDAARCPLIKLVRIKGAMVAAWIDGATS